MYRGRRRVEGERESGVLEFYNFRPIFDGAEHSSTAEIAKC